VTLLPGIDHVLNPRSNETPIVTLNTVTTGCPDRPTTRFTSGFPSMTGPGLPAPRERSCPRYGKLVPLAGSRRQVGSFRGGKLAFYSVQSTDEPRP
jgi:hypothetical protein